MKPDASANTPLAVIQPEWRVDVLTGRTVIVAPARGDRPFAVMTDPPLTRSDDPFAEGQESQTPEERLAIRRPDTAANQPGWLLRVVPNRYPAFTNDTGFTNPAAAAPADPTATEWFPAEPATGEHEVVIECPDGRSRLCELTVEETTRLLLAWQERLRHLSARPGIRSVCVFRNEGFSAGASLSHCHSQIIAARRQTTADGNRFERELAHRAGGGSSLLHDLLEAEQADGTRLVITTPTWSVLCPFASRTAWHVRWVPHQVIPLSFADVSHGVLNELAELVQSILASLIEVLGGDFSFNLLLTVSGPDGPLSGPWSLDLLPRTGRIAGWELMSDCDIITVPPEQAASVLRSLQAQTGSRS